VSVEIYVSPDGDDTNSGTSPAEPLASIDAAQSAVREAIADGMDGDAVVSLRGGTYYREEPLRFGPADAGRDGYEVVYTNYGDERPEVVGGTPITDWEYHENGVYRADVDHTFNGLYEDGTRAVVARHPNQGDVERFAWAEPNAVGGCHRYLRVAETDQERPAEAFAFADGDVPTLSPSDDLQVYVWPGGPDGEWNWFSDILDVAAVDHESNRIELARQARYDLGAGTRYFLRNHPDLLDSPGEFYLDRDAGTVYYSPRGDVDSATVLAPTVDRLIAVRGDVDDRVRNLRFEGLTLRLTDPPRELPNVRFSESDPDGGPTTPRGCIEVTDAEDVTVRRCRVRDTGMHGLLLRGPVERVDVSHNEFRDVGQTGIVLVGHRPHEFTEDVPGARPRAYSNRNHRIRNNHVYNTGEVVGHGHGIELRHSGNNEVAHNRIHHTRRTPIMMTSMPRPTTMSGHGHTVEDPLTVDGWEIAADDAHLFQHARGNVIEHNDLSHGHLDSQDTGLIHTCSSGRGNIVHENRFHHSQVPFSFGFGIYLDDTSDGFVVTNNLVHDLNHEGEGDLRYAVYGKGLRNVFANNVVADNSASVGAHGSYEHGGTHVRDHVVERNVYANSGEHVYGFGNWSVDRIGRADHNVFYNGDGDYGVHGIPDNYAIDGESYDVETLADWTDALGYDGESECADPKFVAPVDDDYRFRYDSPARDHGIEDPDYAAMGLERGYPFPDPEDPLDRLFVRVAGHRGTPGYVAIESGERIRLEPFARTETGYVADLTDVTVSFEVDDPVVASVTDEGVVHGEDDGVATVTTTVVGANAAVSTDLHVLVGEARTEARDLTAAAE